MQKMLTLDLTGEEGKFWLNSEVQQIDFLVVSLILKSMFVCFLNPYTGRVCLDSGAEAIFKICSVLTSGCTSTFVQVVLSVFLTIWDTV